MCQPCKARPEVRHCPTCRQRIVGRATLVEKIAAQVFSDKVKNDIMSFSNLIYLSFLKDKNRTSDEFTAIPGNDFFTMVKPRALYS